MKITDLIPYGSKNAISRKSLVFRCMLEGLTDVISDREMRKLIQKAREDGDVILYNRDGGYYQPTNDDLLAVRKYIKAEHSRAITILKELKHAKVLLADMESCLRVGESNGNERGLD